MKLAIRLSEIRQRLNEIAGLEGDAVTDEVRAEADKLTGDYRDKETQHRAALVAESEEQRTAEGEFGNADGEPAEVRALLDRVNIGDYLAPAAGGIGLTGPAAELNAAFKVATVGKSGGILIPWRMLECPEHRAAPAPRGEAERSRPRARSTAGPCSGRSFNGCSEWTSWARSACESTPFRPA